MNTVKFSAFFLIAAIACTPIKCTAENIGVSAKACILTEDSTGQVLYAENPDEKLPMASTTKIMSALILLENGGLDTPFTADSAAIHVEGSSMGLTEGKIVTGRTLCAGMLLPSGNDAANAAAVRVAGSTENFARLMNLRAAVIGMKNTHFVTPSGLHDDAHYSTARDMAALASEALKNPDFAEICRSVTIKTDEGFFLRNTNKLLTMCSGCIGVKTGFTDEAGRCLVSACERDGVRLICVTLNDRDDWNDHMKLYDMGFSMITKIAADTGDFTENVVGGDLTKIKLLPEKELFYPSAGGKMPAVTYKAVMPPFVYAPVHKGDVIGRLELYADGRKFTECSLISGDESGITAAKPPVDQNFFGKIISFISDLFKK